MHTARHQPSQYSVLGRSSCTLDRICSRLDVQAAQLKTPETFGSLPYLQSGPDLFLPHAALVDEGRAWASRAPIVVPDTAKHETLSVSRPAFSDGTPIRFLAFLPLALGEHSPVHIITLADSAPRSNDVASRLTKFALEFFSAKRSKEADGLANLYQHQNAAIVDSATAAAGMGVWQCHLPNNALTWSAGVYDLFGLKRGAALRRDQIVTQYALPSRDAMEEARAHAIETGTGFRLDAEIFRADGQLRWMRLTATVHKFNGVALRLFGTKQDVTEERRLMEQMRYLAETDAMTGLANRARLQARLDCPEGISALLLIDLDGFKAVNDTYGHAVGDKCLAETARRLRSCCADAPLLGRLGGDEFAVILEGQHSRRDADRMAERIVECMHVPFVYAGTRISLGASVGLAFHRGDAGHELFRQADQALYQAKRNGRRTNRTYDQSRD